MGKHGGHGYQETPGIFGVSPYGCVDSGGIEPDGPRQTAKTQKGACRKHADSQRIMQQRLVFFGIEVNGLGNNGKQHAEKSDSWKFIFDQLMGEFPNTPEFAKHQPADDG